MLLVLIFDNLLAQVPHLYTHIRECICLRLRVLACIHVMTRASHIGVALLVYTHHGLHITRMLTCTFMYTHIHHQQRSATDILTHTAFFYFGVCGGCTSHQINIPLPASPWPRRPLCVPHS